MATKKKKPATKPSARPAKPATKTVKATSLLEDLPDDFDDIEDALAEPLEDVTGLHQITGALAQRRAREQTGTHHLRGFTRADTKLNRPK